MLSGLRDVKFVLGNGESWLFRPQDFGECRRHGFPSAISLQATSREGIL